MQIARQHAVEPRGRIRQGDELDAVEMDLAGVPVVGVAHEGGCAARCELLHAERAGADGREEILVSLRRNHELREGEDGREFDLRSREDEANGQRVVGAHLFDGGHQIARPGLGFRAQVPLHVPHDIRGGQRLAVMEFDAAAQLEHPFRAVGLGRLPGLGEARLDGELLVDTDQTVVDLKTAGDVGVGEYQRRIERRRGIGDLGRDPRDAALARGLRLSSERRQQGGSGRSDGCARRISQCAAPRMPADTGLPCTVRTSPIDRHRASLLAERHFRSAPICASESPLIPSQDCSYVTRETLLYQD